MNVNHKIFRLMLIALLCFLYSFEASATRISGTKCKDNKVLYNYNECCTLSNGKYIDCVPVTTEDSQGQTVVNKEVASTYNYYSCTTDNDCKTSGQKCISGRCQAASETTKASNTVVSPQQISACTSDYGMFSGLITAGGKIFRGLRELIYVVAGFGIIGVAVGGFFGTLNYKWLGAIVISLVIIATTGELINAITGCENFTAQVITDTLKR